MPRRAAGADEEYIGAQQQPAAIPPHRRIELRGLHAYAEKSIAAGETIHFRTSSTVPCQLSVVRLAGDITWPFEIDGFARYCLLNGTDRLDFLLDAETDIQHYEESS